MNHARQHPAERRRPNYCKTEIVQLFSRRRDRLRLANVLNGRILQGMELGRSDFMFRLVFIFRPRRLPGDGRSKTAGMRCTALRSSFIIATTEHGGLLSFSTPVGPYRGPL
jgi:hypothetical protein